MRHLYLIKAPEHNAWCYSTRARLLANNFAEAKIFLTRHDANAAIEEILLCLNEGVPRYSVYDAPDEQGYFDHRETPLKLEVETYTLFRQ
jgi:hypothetical protein